MQFWYVYVLRSHKDLMFYIGSTNDLKRRVLQHQRGENISTAKRLPVEMIYFEGHRSKDDALRREKYFKTTKGKVTLRQILREFLACDARRSRSLLPSQPTSLRDLPLAGHPTER